MEREPNGEMTGWLVIIAILILVAVIAWIALQEKPGEQKPKIELENAVPEVGEAESSSDSGDDEPVRESESEDFSYDEPDASDQAEDEYEPGEPAYDESEFDQGENPDGNYSEGDAPVPPPS